MLFSILGKSDEEIVNKGWYRHLDFSALQHSFSVKVSRSAKHGISTVIIVLRLDELDGISEKVQPFKSFSSFCVNSELGTKVNVPPFSYEIVADDLTETVGLGCLVRASNELFKSLLKWSGI